MKEWAFSICLATVVGCMVKIILPESGMGRLVNLVMSIFLLFCMFSGFVFKDFDINEALAMKKDVSPYMWEVCNSLSHNYNKNAKK